MGEKQEVNCPIEVSQHYLAEIGGCPMQDSIGFVGPDQFTGHFDRVLQYVALIATFADRVASKILASSCVTRSSLIKNLSIPHGHTSLTSTCDRTVAAVFLIIVPPR